MFALYCIHFTQVKECIEEAAMHELGHDGESPLGSPNGARFGEPRGKPDRPFIEVFVVFIAFYLASYIFSGSSQIAISAPEYHLAVIAVNLPRALLVLYLMAISDGLRPFGILMIKRKDAVRGLLCAVGAFAVVLVPGLLFTALGIENSFLAQARSGPRGGAALIPLLLLSSMLTGYCEELFFRSYLMRRLGQAGIPRLWTAIISAILFGSGHGYQGIVGLVSGSLLGLFFAWRWTGSENIHEIAIGHGLFDAAVFAIVLYS
jgi:membrane protease YdiL (CAAX protease family)